MLAKDHKVDIYEKRSLFPCNMRSNGRSINFSVMKRGMEALKLIEVEEQAK